MRGRLEASPLYIVTCGLCGTDSQIGLYSQKESRYAASDARAQGWRNTHRFGWLCSFCGAPRTCRTDRLIRYYQITQCDRRGFPNRNPDSLTFKREFAKAIEARRTAHGWER